MEGRRTGNGIHVMMLIIPTWHDCCESFSGAPYLAAEFAVLSAMQEETIRDINNRQSPHSRVTDTQRGIQGKRCVHIKWVIRNPCFMHQTAADSGAQHVFYLLSLFLPMYLALSSLRSLASFCRCSELTESVREKRRKQRRHLLFN